jgi:NAD(P)-dependent dehydrogenase (short-subunit alcohol dehydrogenase family)
VREERNPMGRLLTPEEVAATILFLAGPGTTGITGTSITVDAGLMAGFDFRTGAEGA